MTEYQVKNESVYAIEHIGDSTVTSAVGGEKQLNLISETDTEKVYKWQKFDLEKGEYVDDSENNTAVTIDGKEYTPKAGKIVMHKGTRSLESAEMALTEVYEENLKLKETMNQLQLAMAEVYEMAANGNS